MVHLSYKNCDQTKLSYQRKNVLLMMIRIAVKRPGMLKHELCSKVILWNSDAEFLDEKQLKF